MGSGGGFVVAWQSFRQDDAFYWGIFARRFNSAGAAQGVAFQVNVNTVGNQRFPAVAVNAGGDFVVAWQSLDQDGSGEGVFARRFLATGEPEGGGELQVNAFTLGAQAYPSVDLDGDRDFVVAWQSYGQDGYDYGVFARRFDSAGSPQASEFQVNGYTISSESRPAVAGNSAGFVIVWQGLDPNSTTFGIFGRSFDDTGAPRGAELQVDSSTFSFESEPAVAMSGDGRFVVSWQSFEPDGSANAIFAQRLAAFALLDADGNGSTEPLTDGLLVLRFLFGFSGATLTSGAVGDDCTRCTASAIETYLQGLL